MPGRKRDHSAPVPWNLAVQLAGSEDRLIEGVSARTWKGWRTQGEVPAYRVLPFLLERLPGLIAERRAGPSVPAPLRRLLEVLQNQDAAFTPMRALDVKCYNDRVADAAKRLDVFAQALRRELEEYRALLMAQRPK